MSDEPSFVDVVNPTPEEIRAWAYSGAFQPMQDWDLVIADVQHLELLLELVGDQSCPSRKYLLDSLYCIFGHSDRTDPRLLSAAETARTASDPWIATWGRRVCQVAEHPPDFKRADWCGLDGFRSNRTDSVSAAARAQITCGAKASSNSCGTPHLVWMREK